MFEIKDLLAKFKKLEDPKEIRNKIAGVMNTVCKIQVLNYKSLEVKRNVIWLKVHPGVKQRIIMNKAKCLEVMKVELPEEAICDIR